MSTTASRQQNYISQVREQAKLFYSAYKFLLASQDEWTAQDYSANLDDGVDGNAGITAASVGAVVFDTSNAIKVIMDGGHATNITSLLE